MKFGFSNSAMSSVVCILAIFLPFTFSSSVQAMSYQLLSPNQAEIFVDMSEVGSLELQASAALMASVFANELKNNETRSLPFDHAGNEGMLLASMASEEQILADLESELKVWQWIETTSKYAGVGALAAGSVALSSMLKNIQGFTPARIAGVVATLAAFVSESAITLISQHKLKTETAIELTKKEINSRFLYLDSQLDSQGHNPSDFEYSQCMWKNTCVNTKICISNGSNSGDCQVTPACTAEIIKCF